MGNITGIDFFQNEEVVKSRLFGICDDEDSTTKTPAYCDLDEGHENTWGAKVTNSSTKDIAFIAVDNAIEIRRDNGDMDNRCDAMLHNDENIIFVELKDQRGNWIEHAVNDQLLTTINVFKKCHNINAFQHRVAYACNKKHPSFAVSHKTMMQKFKNEHGVRLIICRDITIK